MRVTNKMLSDNFLSDMKVNLKNMSTLQSQMASGKEISKPSDDPFKVSKTMQLHTDIDSNTQYNVNIKDTSNWLNTTDTALGQIGDVMQRVRELLISAGDASYSSDERSAINNEVKQKVSEASQLLNTTFNGKYIFGGTRTLDTPVMINSDGNLSYSTPDDADQITEIGKSLKVEVSQGVTVDYNVSATNILNYDPTNDPTGGNSTPDAPTTLQHLFQSIMNHLDGKVASASSTDTADPADLSDIVAKINNEDVTGMTKAISNLLKIRAEVGAKQNRMDSAQQKNTDSNFNMTDVLSKTEDVDITEKTMEFANMQTVYLASLQTSAKVIQPTLMDYMR